MVTKYRDPNRRIAKYCVKHNMMEEAVCYNYKVPFWLFFAEVKNILQYLTSSRGTIQKARIFCIGQVNQLTVLVVGITWTFACVKIRINNQNFKYLFFRLQNLHCRPLDLIFSSTNPRMHNFFFFFWKIFIKLFK